MDSAPWAIVFAVVDLLDLELEPTRLVVVLGRSSSVVENQSAIVPPFPSRSCCNACHCARNGSTIHWMLYLSEWLIPTKMMMVGRNLY